MPIRARAPLRISFAGGGTDVSPFPELEGGVVLSATINRYVTGSMSRSKDPEICTDPADRGVSLKCSQTEGGSAERGLGLLKAALTRLPFGDVEGYDFALHSDVPPGSGLGSSSTMIVALVGLLNEHHGRRLSNHETARLAYTIEREDLGVEGGLQDHYAAAFGGFNFIEFGDQVVVNPLRVPDRIISRLESSLLLCYTGVTRTSGTIIADQTGRVRLKDALALEGLRAQKELAVTMKAALLSGDLDTFGALLGETWTQKKKMSPLITTELIDEAYELALSHGALGGKVTGAGGGGHMLFYCHSAKKHRVVEALQRFGITAMDFRFDRRGLEAWRA